MNMGLTESPAALRECAIAEILSRRGVQFPSLLSCCLNRAECNNRGKGAPGVPIRDLQNERHFDALQAAVPPSAFCAQGGDRLNT